jgi:hypothetical protein
MKFVLSMVDIVIVARTLSTILIMNDMHVVLVKVSVPIFDYIGAFPVVGWPQNKDRTPQGRMKVQNRRNL